MAEGGNLLSSYEKSTVVTHSLIIIAAPTTLSLSIRSVFARDKHHMRAARSRSVVRRRRRRVHVKNVTFSVASRAQQTTVVDEIEKIII